MSDRFQNPDTSNRVDMLGLSERDYQALVRRIEDGLLVLSKGPSGRDSEQIYYQYSGVVLETEHANGRHMAFAVSAWALGRQTLRIFHGAFLYPGTACRITLLTKDGETIRLTAKTAGCEHVTGRVHDVSIAFNDPINIDWFVDTGADDEGDEAPQSGDMQGVIMFYDHNSINCELAELHLKRMGMQTTVLSDSERAFNILATRRFDLALVGTIGRNDKGMALLGRMLEAELSLPCVAVIPSDDEVAQNSVVELGVSGVLTTPYTVETLKTALVNAAPTIAQGSTADVLLSEHWTDPNMRSIILRFLERANESAMSLYQGVQGKQSADLSWIETECFHIATTASGCGFPTIASSSKKVIECVKSRAPITDMRSALLEMCQLIRSAHRVCGMGHTD